MLKNISTNDFVTQYLESLCEVADREGIENLAKPERVVVLVWWGKALVDNGGFQYFYEGALNAEDVAAAFSEIDINSIAEAFRISLNMFTKYTASSGHKLRRQWLGQNPDTLETAFSDLNEVVWRVSETELLDALKGYVEANETSFKHIQVV